MSDLKETLLVMAQSQSRMAKSFAANGCHRDAVVNQAIASYLEFVARLLEINELTSTKNQTKEPPQ